MLYWFAKILFTPFFWLIFRPRLAGRKHLKSVGKAIYVCNHFSLADPVALAALCPRTIHFMAKESLFDNILLKLLLTSLFVFPAGEGGGSRLGPVKRALALLKEEKAFGIFPEGHRSASILEMDELERGAAFIAQRSGAKVIPIYIDPMCWRRMRIRGAVGKPIDPADFANAKGVKPVEAMTRYLASAFDGLREETLAMVSERELKKGLKKA